MKKRLFSRLMAMVMAVTLLSTTALAAPISLSSDLDEQGNLRYSDEAKSEEGVYEYFVEEEKLVLDKTLEVSGDKKVSIELNGNTLALNENLIIDKESGTASVPEGETLKQGSVIKVSNGAELTVTDNSAKKDEDGNYISSGTGTITGGTGTKTWGSNWGGGVYVDGAVGGATFKMEGGNISNNYASGHGGGVNGRYGVDIDITGTTISDNYAGGNGGGIWVDAVNNENATVDLKHVHVENNNGSHGGGCLFAAEKDGQTIANVSDLSVITSNHGRSYVGGVRIYSSSGGTVNYNIDSTSSVCNNTAGEEKTPSNNEGNKDCLHAWGEVIVDTPATCHSTGTSHKICNSGCRENISIDVDPTNHDGGTEIRGAKEPTCTEDGYTGDAYCLGCNGLIEEGEVIPAKGHTHNNWVETTPAQPGVPGVESEICPDCEEVLNTRPIPALPMPIDFGDGTTGGGDTGTAISDEETPLAGLFTRADAIGYLWEHTGSPEAELSTFADVPEDHYWAVAIGWAEDMGIAVADEDGNFRPDDLVLRSSDEIEGELQEFLNRYAVFAGVELEPDELFIALDGAADGVIMGEEAQVIFDNFFAKLEKALAGQEKAA